METREQRDSLTTIVSKGDRILDSTQGETKENDAIARTLRDEMESALSAGDRLPRLAWATPNLLAITQRPLRAHRVYGGSRRDYPPRTRSSTTRPPPRVTTVAFYRCIETRIYRCFS